MSKTFRFSMGCFFSVLSILLILGGVRYVIVEIGGKFINNKIQEYMKRPNPSKKQTIEISKITYLEREIFCEEKNS
jgi:hypothetical protein